MYELDQSGKIEQTELDTVIAINNSNRFTILLSKKNKRILQKTFKHAGKPNIYVYEVFSALIAIAIKAINLKHKVLIDKEYLHHEASLRLRILHLLAKLKFKQEVTIDFGLIGKSSKAHDLAVKTMRKKKKPDKIIKIKEVIDLVLKK